MLPMRSIAIQGDEHVRHIGRHTYYQHPWLRWIFAAMDYTLRVRSCSCSVAARGSTDCLGYRPFRLDDALCARAFHLLYLIGCALAPCGFRERSLRWTVYLPPKPDSHTASSTDWDC